MRYTAPVTANAHSDPNTPAVPANHARAAAHQPGATDARADAECGAQGGVSGLFSVDEFCAQQVNRAFSELQSIIAEDYAQLMQEQTGIHADYRLRSE